MTDEHIMQWAIMLQKRYGWLDTAFSANIVAKHMHGGIQKYVQKHIEQAKLLVTDLEALLLRLKYDKDDGGTL